MAAAAGSMGEWADGVLPAAPSPSDRAALELLRVAADALVRSARWFADGVPLDAPR